MTFKTEWRAETQTRKRKTAALSETIAEMGLKTGTIVTRNEDERMDVEAGTIGVVPAWRFLLGLPEIAEQPLEIFADQQHRTDKE
jgi:predicted AAA+ superfamily ATPase